MAQSIFISHSSKDKQFARQLVHNLETYGLDTWFDSDDIRAGTKWSSAIQEGLNQASVMIVLISPDSMASKNVEDEWQYFLDKKKAIIPVLHRPTDTIHFQLMRIQYIDFVNLAFDDAMQKLLFELHQNNITFSETPSTINAKVTAETAPKKAPPARQNLWLLGLLILILIIGVFAYQNFSAMFEPTATATSEIIATEAPELTAEIMPSPVPEATETTTEAPSFGVLLDVPYVSQFGTEATFANDDGSAAMLMVMRWYAQNNPESSLARRVNQLSVDEISVAARMSEESLTNLTNLLVAVRNYGLPTELCRDLNRQIILQQLDAERPVIVLVDYIRARPEVGYGGGHLLVVIGYDASNIILYDSLNQADLSEAKTVRLSYETFDTVISNVPAMQNAGQGFLFGEGNTCESAD